MLFTNHNNMFVNLYCNRNGFAPYIELVSNRNTIHILFGGFALCIARAERGAKGRKCAPFRPLLTHLEIRYTLLKKRVYSQIRTLDEQDLNSVEKGKK